MLQSLSLAHPTQAAHASRDRSRSFTFHPRRAARWVKWRALP